jgi:hypothetical protein
MRRLKLATVVNARQKKKWVANTFLEGRMLASPDERRELGLMT